MPVSYAQTAELTCPECRASFSAAVWLIVDAAERPDLMERLREGKLHQVTCPNGHTHTVDAPFIIYRPGETPPLLFSPAQGATQEQDREHAGGLLGLLRERLGAAWQDEWLEELPAVPRAALPLALAEGLEAAQQKLAQDTTAELDRLRQENPEAYRRLEEEAQQAIEAASLVRALQEFVQADTWSASQRVVEEHPELLAAEAEALLERLTEAAHAQAAERAVLALGEYQALLRRCREVGVEQAFAERAGSQRTTISSEFQADLRRAVEAEVRYHEKSDLVALDEAAAAWERILQHPDFAALEASFRLAVLNDAGGVYLRRYWAIGRLEDLTRAIQAYEQAVAQTPAGSPGLPRHLSNLGNGLSARYARTGWLPDLERAIQAYEQAVAQTPAGSPNLPGCLNNLGNGLRERYARTGELPDLECAIQAWDQAVAQTPAGSPDLPGYLSNLGNGLRERYGRTGELPDLERAIWAYKQAVRESPASSPECAAILNNLGLGLRTRYMRTGQLPDLERAIQAYEQAVAQTPTGSPDLLRYLNNLGNGLRERYARTGELPDLERAIRAYEQAVRETPAGSPDLLRYLNNLGLGLHERYARMGQLPDLERAIRAWEQAVRESPTGSPDLLRYLNNLGLGLRDRYGRTGELPDLEQAIQAYEQAVRESPFRSPDLPGYLNNLGLGLRDRYARTGELPDLERALASWERSVAETPAGSPDLPSRLNNLGNGLCERSGRTGELPDLERAIRAWEQAVRETPTGSLDLLRYLSNLGNGLSARYARTGQLPDLERAIQAYEQAVRESPTRSPDLPSYLNNLGNGLRDRYMRTGQLPDLERAIRAYEQAVAQTPAGSPNLPSRLNNLGNGLRDRYARTRELGDLERALASWERAVAETPAGSTDLAAILNSLGNGLRDRYGRTGELGDLERAIGTWERAWSSLEELLLSSSLDYKLGQQRQWARLYARLVAGHLQMAQANPASGPTARRRALEVAEGTKSRLLAELMGRAEGLPAPMEIPQGVVARERALQGELKELDAAGLTARGRELRPEEWEGEEARRRERFGRRGEILSELGELWPKMVDYGPQAADYVALRRGEAPKWADMARLAADLGPDTALLALFTTGERTLLFILREGWEEPVVISTDLSGTGWADLSRRFRREMHLYDHTGRRGETWIRPLLPLVEQAAGHLASVQRVILAPEASGHLLPWAILARRAGWPGTLVTLPALGLLPRLRQRPAYRDGGALVAGNPRLTPEFRQWLREQLQVTDVPDLPYAELEAREVAKMLHGDLPFVGPHVTKAAVLERLADASIVHLATHAYFAPGSPLDSGIILADGILTAREVMGLRLRADLLVLSACQTGMAGSLGGDEMAGLAQAFLQAGARSLLVSLWTVNDPATAALMTAFCAAREEGADKAQALSQAMDHVRDQQKWTHPYYWGAFVLMGDWS